MYTRRTALGLLLAPAAPTPLRLQRKAIFPTPHFDGRVLADMHVLDDRIYFHWVGKSVRRLIETDLAARYISSTDLPLYCSRVTVTTDRKVYCLGLVKKRNLVWRIPLGGVPDGTTEVPLKTDAIASMQTSVFGFGENTFVSGIESGSPKSKPLDLQKSVLVRPITSATFAAISPTTTVLQTISTTGDGIRKTEIT